MFLRIACIVVCCVSIASLAMGQDNPPTPPNSDAPADQNSPEKFFVADAARINRLSREIGLMAMTHAQSAEVKAYAKSLIEFHDKFTVELNDLAKAMRQSIPAKLDKPDQEELDAMRKLHGPAFDRRFVTNMITLQRKGLGWFESAAERGSDTNMKKLAEKSLPALKEHLKNAEALSESVDRKEEKEKETKPQSQPAGGTPKKNGKPGSPEKPVEPEKPEKP